MKQISPSKLLFWKIKLNNWVWTLLIMMSEEIINLFNHKLMVNKQLTCPLRRTSHSNYKILNKVIRSSNPMNINPSVHQPLKIHNKCPQKTPPLRLLAMRIITNLMWSKQVARLVLLLHNKRQLLQIIKLKASSKRSHRVNKPKRIASKLHTTNWDNTSNKCQQKSQISWVTRAIYWVRNNN